MDFEKCMRERRSVRRFTAEPIERDTIERIVELASYAPSWKNTQTARYNAVYDRAVIERIADECVYGFEWNSGIIKGAPLIVLLTTVTGISGFEKDGSYSTSKGDKWEVFDAGLACENFCLAAHCMGLGSVILGIFDEASVKAAAAIAEGENVAAIIAIGHPAEAPKTPRRKPVSELLRII